MAELEEYFQMKKDAKELRDAQIRGVVSDRKAGFSYKQLVSKYDLTIGLVSQFLHGPHYEARL